MEAKTVVWLWKFFIGRVKTKSRATNLLGQSQVWGVNQQVLYRLFLIQLQCPYTVPKLLGSQHTLTHKLTDLRWQEGASLCWAQESEVLEDVPQAQGSFRNKWWSAHLPLGQMPFIINNTFNHLASNGLRQEEDQSPLDRYCAVICITCFRFFLLLICTITVKLNEPTCQEKTFFTGRLAVLKVQKGASVTTPMWKTGSNLNNLHLQQTKPHFPWWRVYLPLLLIITAI